MKLYIGVFLMVLFLSVPCAPALAQQEHIDLSVISKIPTFEHEMSYEEFRKVSELYEEKQKEDKYLSYRIRLPRGWNKAPSSIALPGETGKSALSERILGELTKFYGPGRIETLSRFEVVAQSLDFEVTAKNWFMQEVLLRGFTLEGLKVLSDKRVEVLYNVVEGDTSFVVRVAAEINGPRMIVASYYVPEQFWPEERALQQHAIESFEFVKPEKGQIEKTRTHEFMDLLAFDYPSSWRITCPSVYTLEGFECFLTYSVDSKTISGDIHVGIVSNQFEGILAEEIQFRKEEMEKRGLILADAPRESRSGYELPGHVYYNVTEVYDATDKRGKILPHEFWISVMEEDRYYYVVTMLTLARESEFYTWARNAESFQTVVENFRPAGQ